MNDHQHISKRFGSRSYLLIAILLAILPASLSACTQRDAMAPVVPGAVLETALPEGVHQVASLTPSPGPWPTPTPAATKVLAPPEELFVPPDFGVSLFAENVGPVRMLAYSPSGDLFASQPQANRIVAITDRLYDGVMDEVHTFAEEAGLNQPNGIAFRPGWLYVANTDGIVRFPYQPGDLKATGGAEMVLPLPAGGQSPLRALAFGPDGALYVSIGASCNACQETDLRRAAVLRVAADGEGSDGSGGSGGSIGTIRSARFAQGLHFAGGLAFQPETHDLWATEDSRDELGDNLPPEELNRLTAAANYGWPFCFGAQQLDATVPGASAAFCRATTPPAVALPPHVTPTGLAFYNGRMFPADYRGSLFVAYAGSTTRSIPVGYSVARVPFSNGAPSGPAEDFVRGWLHADTRRWGRPVDVAVAPDGALMVSDEGGGRVYRVFYSLKPTPTPHF